MRRQSATFLAVLFLYGADIASAASSVSAYTQDSNGGIVRSESGLCWRTGYWSAREAATGCDGELTPPVGKPTAPDFSPTAGQPASVAPLALPATKRCDFRIVVNNDNNFGFGQDHLSGAGKKRLAAEFHQKVTACGLIESVTISAYTDRLGNATRNQQLAERRAASLATVLKADGITAPIEAKGFGSAQPITQCSGRLEKNALIRCLAPDRRATIEVRGIAK